MADTYIQNRLVAWAIWSERRDGGGLGFKKKVSWHTETHGTAFAGTPEFSEECNDIDKCVVALHVENEQLYQVIMLEYRMPWMTLPKKLKQLGCCKQTYYNKIPMAHRQILGYLNDIAAGVKLPVFDVKKTA